MTDKKPGAETGGELAITRTFDAPRELVWRAWTEPEMVKRWWGPKDFTAPVIKIDLREGGTYLFCMRSPEGKDYWSTGTYRKIVVPEWLVCTDSFADETGRIVPAAYYGLGTDFPLELVMNMLFEPRNDRTAFTLRHEGMPSGAHSDEARQGWNESLDKFALVLAEMKRGKRS